MVEGVARLGQDYAGVASIAVGETFFELAEELGEM